MPNPRKPIKAMLITALLHASVSGVLITLAALLGLNDPYQPGYAWLSAALIINAPGAILFTAAIGTIALTTGKFDGVSDLSFTIGSAILSSPVYSFLALWIATVFHRLRSR